MLLNIGAGRSSMLSDQTAMDKPRIQRIVFATCHPDDEALWIGGLLHSISQFSFLEAYVICLSGRDPQSARMAEFEAARQVAGYADGVIVGGPLRAATDPLPEPSATLEEGLRSLGLRRDDIALLVTHSTFGDEHLHPHHRQANMALRHWSRNFGIPFGYFSCLPIPYFRHIPIVGELRRYGSLHLLHAARCEFLLQPTQRAREPTLTFFAECPGYYVQFLTEASAKSKMLSCYTSIGLVQHQRGYSMFTNPCEALYLMDEEAYRPFADLIESMDIPSDVVLVPPPHLAIDPDGHVAAQAVPRRNFVDRVGSRLVRALTRR